MPLSKEKAKKLLYFLLKIRIVDEFIAEVYPTDVIKCPVHLSIGSEAVAVGVCQALGRDDFVIGGHRSHGIYLAKGAPLNGFMAEMYGRETGCAGGKGGSMHLISPEFGLVGTTPILGATIPIGVGVALASKLKGEDKITAIFFGDGATEEGVFYESLNLAALKKAPTLFVCENNRYSIFQRQEIRQPLDNIYKRGEVFGIPGKRVDGNNVVEVYEAALRATHHTRTKGPYLLECLTNRWRQHVGPYYDYELGFGDKNEIEKMMAEQDPVKNLITYATIRDLFDENYVELTRKRIQREIKSAMEFVNRSSLPGPEKLYCNLY